MCEGLRGKYKCIVIKLNHYCCTIIQFHFFMLTEKKIAHSIHWCFEHFSLKHLSGEDRVAQ
jgi:hypothetical protein